VAPAEVGTAQAPGEEVDGAEQDERVVQGEAPDLLGAVQVLGALDAEDVEAGPRRLDVAVWWTEPDVAATRTTRWGAASRGGSERGRREGGRQDVRSGLEQVL